MKSYSNNPVAASSFETLGPVSHYNGLFFGNVTSMQADCEGAMAIGGNAQFGSPGYSYDIGGAGEYNSQYTCIGEYQNDKGYPSLLLGGKVSQASTSARIHGGDAALKNGYKTEYQNSSFQFEGSCRYVSDSTVDGFFEAAKEQAKYTAEILHHGTDKTIPVADLMTINKMDHKQYENKDLVTNKKVLIYTIACSKQDTVTINEIDLDSFIYDYDLIVISADAGTIRFANGAILFDRGVIDTSLPRYYDGNKIIGQIASRLVFTFPNAQEIQIQNYGVIGSIIAPNALVSTNGGSVNGMLIADSFYQSGGTELHAFHIAMEDDIFALDIDEVMGGFEIRKQNADGTLGLTGAEFDLFEYDGEEGYEPVITGALTGEGGVLAFSQLLAGVYKLVERKPPWGYILPRIHEWTVELVIDNKGEMVPLDILYIKNTLALGSAAFIKRDEEEHSIKLSGAVFSLYMWNEEDNQYDLLSTGHTTGQSGELVIEELVPAKYKLVETEAPTGYFLPENYEIEFEVELDADGDVVTVGPVDIDNQKLASVEITKRDSQDAQKMLENAVFTLYKFNSETDEFEKISEGLTTDENGVLSITDLGPGEYKLTETAAPDGYYLDPENADTTFTVEVDREGRLVKLTPIAIGNKELGKIQIYKVDEDDDKIVLEGAQFTLYKYNDETAEFEVYRTGLTSDENGSLLIDGLEPGDYKLVEIKSPRGYVLPEDPETLFSITLA